MLRLQKPVPCVDFSSPAAWAALPNRLEPTPMVSTAALDDCMNLRRLKSIDSRSGRCVHPILSHMVGSPLRWIDDCEQPASAHLRPTPRRAGAGRPEMDTLQESGALRALFAAIGSSTPVSGASPVAHVTVRGRCNHTIPPRGANIATSQQLCGTPTVAIAEATLRWFSQSQASCQLEGISSRRVRWLECARQIGPSGVGFQRQCTAAAHCAEILCRLTRQAAVFRAK